MKKPLTILICSYDWQNLAQTNPEQLRAKLARDQLDPEGNHIVLVQWGNESYDVVLDEHIRVIHRRARLRSFRPLYDLISYVSLPRLLWAHRITPDLCFASDLGGALSLLRVKKAFAIPLVFFTSYLPTSLYRARGNGFLHHAYNALLTSIVRGNIDAVFAISDATATYAAGLGVSYEHIHRFLPATIPADVDERVAAARGTARKKHSIAPGTKIILSVGRLEEEKNYAGLLRAFSTLKDTSIQLVLVGDGVLRDALQDLPASLGIQDRVIFAGVVPHDELWGYYADCDIFVLLSKSEALGMALLEAMAAGKPVLVSRVGGLHESVGHNEERGSTWMEEDGLQEFEKRVTELFRRSNTVQEKVNRAKDYVQKRMEEKVDLHAAIQ